MTKLITIDYEEYLDLIKCKEILDDIKLAGDYISAEDYRPRERKLIFRCNKLHDFLLEGDLRGCNTIELVRED